MSLFKKRDLAALEIGYRRDGYTSGSVNVTADSALRHSAVWACLRLRGDLISTTPVDVFRRVNGAQFEVPKPSVLVSPGGDAVDITEWLYSTQVDLDRYGNAYALITERDGLGFPKRLDLLSAGNVTVVGKGMDITGFRVRGVIYDPRDIWHEKQNTIAGLPVGISAIYYASQSIGGYLSAQQFALDWFASGAAPTGHLKNTEAKLTPEAADTAKNRFKAAVQNRDVYVSGADWEFEMASIPASESAFLEQMQYGVTDVCRFLSVPADMIDGQSVGSNITYANVTQRNLQLLITNLGPVFIRRERALSKLTPSPRFVKFNTDAILRMDPAARGEAILSRVSGKTITPDEAREFDNLPPLTEAQWAELERMARISSPPKLTTGVTT